MNLYSAEQCQQLDQIAIQQFKIPGLLLMKKAAFHAFHHLQQHWPDANHITVICGAGNNGGDGFMLAQYAVLHGLNAQILIPDTLENYHAKLSGDALSAFNEARQLKLVIETFSPDKLIETDLIIDAIFGTGLDREISGHYQQIIETINQSACSIIALDVPSGIHATTGAKLGIAVQADMTITFIGEKTGLLMAEGGNASGQIAFEALDLADECYRQLTSIASKHDLDHWQQQLPTRPLNAHKGTAGTSLLIGGNHNMMGAIQLASQAALKAGSGLVKVITQPQHLTAITSHTPELMCYPPEQLTARLNEATAIAIGPGLGLDTWANNLFQQILNWQVTAATPMIMDADALKLLADQTASFPKNPNWILTPHPGEAAVLLNTTTDAIQKDRLQAIQQLQQRYGGVILLKGNGTLIYDGQQMELCPLGNPGMAVGGMGDVLTGMITGYLAQGLSLFTATCLAVYHHAAIADVYTQHHPQNSLLPSDIIKGLSVDH